MTSATERSTRPGRRIALVALVALLIAFTVYYLRARSSEEGTHRDDSPAAEAGVGKPAGGGNVGGNLN